MGYGRVVTGQRFPGKWAKLAHELVSRGIENRVRFAATLQMRKFGWTWLFLTWLLLVIRIVPL